MAMVSAVEHSTQSEDAGFWAQREMLLGAQKDAFQAAMNGGSLATSLGFLVKVVTDWASDGRRCAFYVANAAGTGLTHVVGMSEAYARDVDGFQISPQSFACGLAIAIGEAQITPDVMAEPKWSDWTWMASDHGFRGCWSFPIEAAGKRVGSFAMYHAKPLNAEARDLELAEDIIQTAAIIISQYQETTRRLDSEERYRALNDTLERRVAERSAELGRAEEQLRQSQKMEAVGQLTGGLAHDFNNLLMGISGAMEMVAKRVAQGRFTGLEKYIDMAQGATGRAAALTHRLLAFSRRQPLAPKATNAHDLVEGMLDLIQRTVGPSIEIDLSPAADLWSALVDPQQLENALLNLCINARDAMPHGGMISIATRNLEIDKDRADFLGAQPGEYVALSVRDTGSGMDQGVIDKAFEPFFTTKPIGEGTGLGLSMIYGFVQQSGGQVRIESQVGEGTLVCLYLPRHDAPAQGEDAGIKTAAASHVGGGEVVLVVDDEPSVRVVVSDLLEDLGYHTVEAADGSSGLRILQSDARIDLVVTDVGLPGGMNGRQMVDAARGNRPDLKSLFITGFAEEALFQNGNLDPNMSVLTKPFAMDMLARRVRELTSERKAPTESTVRK